MALDKTEAHEMAEAISNVSRHYDVEASEKAMDWSRLVMALGMVYGPRLYAIRQNRKAQPASERHAPQQAANSRSGNIVEIPGVGKVDVGTAIN